MTHVLVGNHLSNLAETSKVNNFEIKRDNDFISDDLDIANVFNVFLVNIPSKLKKSIQPSEFKLLYNFVIYNLMMTQTLLLLL